MGRKTCSISTIIDNTDENDKSQKQDENDELEAKVACNAIGKQQLYAGCGSLNRDTHIRFASRIHS